MSFQCHFFLTGFLIGLGTEKVNGNRGNFSFPIRSTSLMGLKRKASGRQVPLCKEVELVPVKTKRLGTRLRARPVRQPQGSGQKKVVLPEGSPKKACSQGSGNQPSSSNVPFHNFDDDVYIFDDHGEDKAGGSSTPSMKKKKPGKVGRATAFVEILLTIYKDPEPIAVGMATI
jgi:hypothetical protein